MTSQSLYDDRPACVQCCLKHIAQARAIVFETKKGYPEHYYYAMGHMAEAEDEICTLFPWVMEAIRKARLEYQEDQSKMPNWKYLIHVVLEAEAELSDKMLEELKLKWDN